MTGLYEFEFARHALLAALILGPACALLGVLVTLRGQSFLSDALAHSAVTGVALGLWFREATGWEVDTTWTVLPFCIVLALGITWLQERTPLRTDAVITVSFAGSLALGFLILAAIERYTLLEGILFGSIYTITRADLFLQVCLGVVIFTLFATCRKAFTLALVQPDLARLQGLHPGWLNAVIALLVAFTVALCIKMVGALLLGALIVIPASAGRLVAKSFAGMVLATVAIGFIGPVSGVLVSLNTDLPTGPVVVLSLLALLAGCLALRPWLMNRPA